MICVPLGWLPVAFRRLLIPFEEIWTPEDVTASTTLQSGSVTPFETSEVLPSANLRMADAV